MHNKLDVGRSVIQDLHRQGGGGLATSPTTGEAKLSLRNKQLMAANMFHAVKQFTSKM